jgi:hypothetical protein
MKLTGYKRLGSEKIKVPQTGANVSVTIAVRSADESS